MFRLLLIFGEWLLKNSVKTILLGAGLALATTAGMLATLDIFISRLQGQANSMASDAIQMLALSGFPTAFSMIIGAVVYRLTVNASLKVIKK